MRAFDPPLWNEGPDGQISRVRHAEHWHRQGSQVACDLCYRRCVLSDGEPGWCQFRSARGGRMELDSHGIVSSLLRQVRGYAVDPFLTYKPGATSIFLGGVSCTAGCTFCMSTQAVHRPAAVPWASGRPRMIPGDSQLYANRAMLHPRDAIAAAKHHDVLQVEFGINEPTLSFEWTSDVAGLARRQGLDVVIETNGFTEPRPLRQLAKLTSAVDVGTKGSLSEEFYTRVMRSPGAPDAVRRALVAWRESGVHLTVGDLIAPPFMQPDHVFSEAAARFYGWIAEHLGPLTIVVITPVMPPGPQRSDGRLTDMLHRTPADLERYTERLYLALRAARRAGLPYAHLKGPEAIRCHACGGVLLAFTENCDGGRKSSGTVGLHPCTEKTVYCPYFSHVQHVTDGLCDHCGTAVPVVCLSPTELEGERAKVRAAARAAGLVLTGDDTALADAGLGG